MPATDDLEGKHVAMLHRQDHCYNLQCLPGVMAACSHLKTSLASTSRDGHDEYAN